MGLTHLDAKTVGRRLEEDGLGVRKEEEGMEGIAVGHHTRRITTLMPRMKGDYALRNPTHCMQLFPARYPRRKKSRNSVSF